jgi:hypothetical protein
VAPFCFSECQESAVLLPARFAGLILLVELVSDQTSP